MDKSGVDGLLPRHHMLRDLNLVLEYKGEASSASGITGIYELTTFGANHTIMSNYENHDTYFYCSLPYDVYARLS
jgi:hypothetical protein